MTELRAIDICAGGGGWATAARGLPVRVIAAFDKEMDCLLTYKHNHPQTLCIQCDVEYFDFTPFAGRVDLVLGGIPCEPLSAARRHVPLSESKRAAFLRLMHRCIEIPREVGATWTCLEDIVGIVKHLPLFTPHMIIDSAHFSAQRRKRVYVGNCPLPKSANDPRKFSSAIRRGPYRRSMLLKGRVPARSKSYNGGAFYPWVSDEKAPTVLQLGSRHDNHAAAQFGDTWRQLEWQELASLQGFPDDYLFVGTGERTRKMVGQSIQIDTGRAILRALCEENKG